VPGHGNNVSPKSQWPKGQNSVQLTQEAWMNGTPVRADGSVKTYEILASLLDQMEKLGSRFILVKKAIFMASSTIMEV